MNALALPHIDLSRRWVWRPDKWRENDVRAVGRGAREVRDALEALEIEYWYEPWEYELKVDESGVIRGVCFDFWLPAHGHWPEVNIEVSETKHPGKKLRKIKAVEELYGISTLFVNWPTARAIRRRQDLLGQLVEDMLAQRHPELALVS